MLRIFATKPSCKNEFQIMTQKDFLAPALLLTAFFILQAMGLVGERGLTILVILAIIVTLLLRYRHGELLLLTIGILAGGVIEIGLRFVGFQQVWNNASLFGVPYWLPLIWGFGFVVITRLGIYITSARYQTSLD